MSVISSLSPFACSISSRRSTPTLVRTRSVFFSDRMINRVSSSEAATIARLTLSCTGASLVAMKRVPMFMPAAPIASAATRLRASAIPPEATNGIFNSSAARGSKIIGNVVFARMAAAFETVDADRIASDPFGLERVPHRGAFVDDLDAGRLHRRHVLLGTAAGRLDDSDPAFDDGRDIFGIGRRAEGWEKRQIDAERFV